MFTEANEKALLDAGEIGFVIALEALQKPDLAERGAVLLTNLLTYEEGREIMRHVALKPTSLRAYGF